MQIPKVPPINIKAVNKNESNGFSKGEENIIRSNMEYLLTGECLTRALKDKPNENNIVINAIKRYIVLNNSEQEFRIRFSFSLNDDFVNSYIPASDLIVYSKKNSLNQIHVFTKSDINFPWSEVEIKVECEPREDESSPAESQSNGQGSTVKKSQSYDNLPVQGPQNKDALGIIILI